MVQEPPSGRIVGDGSQAGLGQSTVLGPAAVLAALVVDATGGPSPIVHAIDGETVDRASWSQDRPPGPYVVTGTVTAGNGLTAELEPLPIIWDPVPPVISSDVGSESLFHEFGLDQGEKPKKPKRSVETHDDIELLWSVDGIRWLPVLEPGSDAARWEILADVPQLFLMSRRDRPFAESGPVLRRGEVLRVEARDEHSAVSELWLEASAERLTIESTDLVGNASTVVWSLDR